MITGKDLTNRGPEAPPRRARRDEPSPVVEPAVAASRLAQVLAMRAPAQTACGDCWRAGRDAVVRAVEAGQEPTALDRPGAREHQHVLAAWRQGRDAALERLTGA